MTDLITGEQVMEQLRAVVAEFGEDYVYRLVPTPSVVGSKLVCVYQVDGKPSCIAAQVLHRLGVDLNLLREGMAVSYHTKELPLTGHALHTLNIAQQYQDTLRAWGRCLEAAEAYYELYKDREFSGD